MDLGNILAAVGVLAVVIFVHELGHFLLAKWCDVEVLCFSMGFGPTVYSKTVGETEYRLAAIPLGGYVRMAGQDDDEIGETVAHDPSRGFTAKTIGQRAAIIAAGPAFNLIFAVVVFTFVAYLYGVTLPSNRPIVGGILPDTPAEAAGLAVGDKFVELDGVTVDDWNHLQALVVGSSGEALNFTVENLAGERREIALTPAVAPVMDEFGEVTEHSYQIGIARILEQHPVGLFDSFGAGFSYTGYYSAMIFRTLGRLVQGRLEFRDLGGPILIAQVASEKAERGMEPLLRFLALISINLGIINVLPIPVLDGGHLVFLGFEGLRGKPLSLRMREMALQAGMMVIGALMIFVVFNDLFRIYAG